MQEPTIWGIPGTEHYSFYRVGEIGENSIARCYSCGHIGKVKKKSGKFKGFSMDGPDEVIDLFLGKIHYKKIPAHFECSECGCYLLELIEDKHSKRENVIEMIRFFLGLICVIYGIVAIIIRIF